MILLVRRVKMRRTRMVPILYMLPALMMLALFVYYPLVRNVVNGFYEWNPFTSDRRFVFADNYLLLFKDPVFYTVLKNNLLYAVISVIMQVGLGLVIAAVLEDKIFRRFSTFFRTTFFIPVLISMTVIEINTGKKKVVRKKVENLLKILSSNIAAITNPSPTCMITEIMAYNRLFFNTV